MTERNHHETRLGLACSYGIGQGPGCVCFLVGCVAAYLRRDNGGEGKRGENASLSQPLGEAKLIRTTVKERSW